MSDEIEKLREELAEANARRADMRTALEWANEERDRLREQLAAKHSACPDCADYAARSGRFAEQADRLQRERDEHKARREEYASEARSLRERLKDAYRERDEAREELDRYKGEHQYSVGLSMALEQRDEARAEVERLRVDIATSNESFTAGYKDGARDAFRRGAEAMREACAACVAHLSHEDGLGMGSQRIEGALRVLPTPEER